MQQLSTTIAPRNSTSSSKTVVPINGEGPVVLSPCSAKGLDDAADEVLAIDSSSTCEPTEYLKRLQDLASVLDETNPNSIIAQ